MITSWDHLGTGNIRKHNIFTEYSELTELRIPENCMCWFFNLSCVGSLLSIPVASGTISCLEYWSVCSYWLVICHHSDPCRLHHPLCSIAFLNHKCHCVIAPFPLSIASVVPMDRRKCSNSREWGGGSSFPGPEPVSAPICCTESEGPMLRPSPERRGNWEEWGMRADGSRQTQLGGEVRIFCLRTSYFS